MTTLFLSCRDELVHDHTWLSMSLTIRPGVDVVLDHSSVGLPDRAEMRRHFGDAVARCQALVVLVGPGWLDAPRWPGGPRALDDEYDRVRLTIEAAFQR